MVNEDTPEFDLLKIKEKIEVKIEDIGTIAIFGLHLAFMAYSRQNPKECRKYKDTILKVLRREGLDKSMVDFLEVGFIDFCDRLDP